MKTIWIALGRLLHFVSWPALFFYLRNSKRTRILVVSGDDILLVKGWYSGGDWSLPGGGLRRGEEWAVGAVRELREETGIDVSPKELDFITELSRASYGTRYSIVAYALETGQRPATVKQRIEIVDLAWINWRQVYDSPDTKPYIKRLIKERFEA